jgi:hypothetical protein
MTPVEMEAEIKKLRQEVDQLKKDLAVIRRSVRAFGQA